MTLSPIVHRPDDDPEVPLDGCSELTRAFVLLTRTPDAVLPLLGPGLQERLRLIQKPHLDIECRGDLLPVTHRFWIEPNDARALLEQASWILDDLRRACPR